MVYISYLFSSNNKIDIKKKRINYSHLRYCQESEHESYNNLWFHQKRIFNRSKLCVINVLNKYLGKKIILS